MKSRIAILTFLSLVSLRSFAQKERLAVIGLDVTIFNLRSYNLNELVRVHLREHGNYEIIDRYEVSEILTENNIKQDSCFRKKCVMEAGALLKADKIVTGSIDLVGNSYYIRTKLWDVKTSSLEKEAFSEFKSNYSRVNIMVTIVLNKLINVENEAILEENLSADESYKIALENPYLGVLKLSGPRMGYTFLTGEAAEVFEKPESKGGYGGSSALFQFGYQFEKQYLNEGKVQALFEFIPMVSGIDQGVLIPSITVMNGIRNNVNGLEFALGPSLNWVKQSKQFQDEQGVWHQIRDKENVNGADEVMRLDSRGDTEMKSYLVIAAGYSFKAGKLNIPINAYVVPSKNNMRYGFSFGFNARK